MKIGVKLLLAAVLSLSIGVAFASPLLITDLDVIPFRKIPQGPKADFSIDIVYAMFVVQGQSDVATSSAANSHFVDYQVVLNITNLSDVPAKVSMIDYGAAKNIVVEMSALGSNHISQSSTGTSSGTTASIIEGVWLDDRWLNVTWIPGEYPEGLHEVFSQDSEDKLPTAIPDLPTNALDTGCWIEGVPIRERHVLNARSGVIKTYTGIYINGAWIDVTGRVRADYPQPSVMATNTLVYETLHIVSDSFFNAKTPQVPTNLTSPYHIPGTSVLWSGEGGFNKNWQPHQSRLIMLRGTKEVHNTEGLDSLTTGEITLYSAVSNYLKDKEETNGTLVNTRSTATNLKQIRIEKTTEGYVYNTVLGKDQIFQPDMYGVEVFIKPRS